MKQTYREERERESGRKKITRRKKNDNKVKKAPLSGHFSILYFCLVREPTLWSNFTKKRNILQRYHYPSKYRECTWWRIRPFSHSPPLFSFFYPFYTSRKGGTWVRRAVRVDESCFFSLILTRINFFPHKNKWRAGFCAREPPRGGGGEGEFEVEKIKAPLPFRRFCRFCFHFCLTFILHISPKHRPLFCFLFLSQSSEQSSIVQEFAVTPRVGGRRNKPKEMKWTNKKKADQIHQRSSRQREENWRER